MMRTKRWIAMIVLPLAMTILVTTADAQGYGKGQAKGKTEKAGKVESKGQSAGKAGKKTTGPTAAKGASAGKKNGASSAMARGRSAERPTGSAAPATPPASRNASPRALIATSGNRGATKRLARDLRVSEVRPAIRTFIVSNRPSQFVTGGAVAYAFARGTPDNALMVVPAANQVFIRNRKGEELLVLDDNRARNLGAWQVAPLNNQVKEGSPSFCRSGAGHPVWGRQWCIDKGFGLGANEDVRWGTTRTVSDIIFGRRPTTTTLPRSALLSLLGPTAFDRLALHAVTLGYTDPLTGTWHSEATGPEVLLVNSGRYPIAELVDTNRDGRGDLMLVALRPW